jgi:hypothetical protein
MLRFIDWGEFIRAQGPEWANEFAPTSSPTAGFRMKRNLGVWLIFAAMLVSLVAGLAILLLLQRH